MTSYSTTKKFDRQFEKLDRRMQELVLKRMKKIVEQPDLGKPMHKPMQNLKSERIEKLRIIYKYWKKRVEFLYFDHRDHVY